MASQLLINEPPLQVLPTLAQLIGLNKAIVLQQVHYWLNPQFNKNWFEEKYWVFNTFEQWQKQFPFWSERTIQRITANLEEEGLLITFITPGFQKTKYYTIDYDRLNQVSSHDPVKPVLRISSDKTVETQVGSPSRQSDVIDNDSQASPVTATCYPRGGQAGIIDHDNLSSSLTENTSENTSENSSEITPPLLPFPDGCARDADEDEEKEKNCPRQQQQPEEEEEEKKSGWGTAFSTLPVQMIRIWNQAVQSLVHPGTQACLTPHRQQQLNTFWELVLKPREGDPDNNPEGNPLEPWQQYCSLIASSQFLSGRNATGFKVTLDWALNPVNGCKILEGAFFDKPALVWHNPSPTLRDVGAAESAGHAASPPPQPWDGFACDLDQSLADHPFKLDWIKISVALAKTIGQHKYLSWFGKVGLVGLSDTTATFSVEGRFTKEYIYNNFRDALLGAVQACHASVQYLDFQLAAHQGG